MTRADTVPFLRGGRQWQRAVATQSGGPKIPSPPAQLENSLKKGPEKNEVTDETPEPGLGCHGPTQGTGRFGRAAQVRTRPAQCRTPTFVFSSLFTTGIGQRQEGAGKRQFSEVND